MQLINQRLVQRNARFPVSLPVESIIDYDRLGNAPRIIAEILGQIFVCAANDIAKHLVRPVHLACDRFRVWIEKELCAVEPQTAFRIIRAGNSKAVQLSGSYFGQKHMPHLIGMFGHRNPNIFLARVDVIEETKINRSSRFGKKRKVHAVAQPRRTEWIWITKPGLYRSHKVAAFLSNMEGVGNSRFALDPTSAL